MLAFSRLSSKGVLVGDLSFRVGQAAAASRQQPRGVQLDQLVGEGGDHLGGLQGMEVETQLDRLFKVDQGREPTRTDRAGIAGPRGCD